MSSAAMENFVMNVRTLSSQGNFSDLNEFLQKNMDVLMRNPAHLGTVMDTLDIQQHSMGVLAILTARLQQSQINDWEDLFHRLTLFIMDCNGEQIRFAAQSFGELCHLFADQVIQRNTPLIGISPLMKAIAKLQMDDQCLTSVHSDVARLALASRCFTKPILDLLDVNFNAIATEAASNSKHILLFFYYAGMIYSAVKQFSKALFYFEACVTVPAIVVSHIMLEAYKKYILVWLIVHGDMPKESLAFPKYTSPLVNKYIKNLCTGYHEVFKAFYATQHNDLEACIVKYSGTFAEDGNTGLVNQVVMSRQKTAIKRLTQTFLTLSLQDVATKVGLSSPAEAEKQLLSMIEEGSIYARISQKDGMVTFDTNPERYNTVKMLRQLESNVEKLIAFDKHITSMDEEITLNPKFVKMSGSQAGGGASAARASASAELDEDVVLANATRGPSSSTTVNSNNINYANST